MAPSAQAITLGPDQRAAIRGVHNAILDAEIDLQHYARNGWTPEGAYRRVERLKDLRHQREQLRRDLLTGAGL